MPGSWLPSTFPNLTNNNHNVTSPKTRSYNCIAWAAGDDERWWWPDPFKTSYWPPGTNRGESLQDFMDAYSQLGYVRCSNGTLEVGLEKIAIFATTSAEGYKPAHAARQLESGCWTSKIGEEEDISHTNVRDVECSEYGQVVVFMSRPR